VVFFTRTATLFQLVPFLGAESFGLDVGTIGVAITVFAFMNFAMLPITTPLIEKFGARANVLWYTLATAVGLAVLYLSSAQIGFWLAVVMLGAATGVNYPAISTFTIAALPRERFGPGMGMQRTFGDVGFVFGPVIVGALSDFTGGGHGAVMALNIVLLGAAVSALFANDGAALILTPIVIAMLRALGFKDKATLAFVMAAGFIADTASLPLVVSNLVNIVSADFFKVGFGEYASVMVPVDLVSIAVTLGALMLFFRRDIPQAYDVGALRAPHEAIRDAADRKSVV
jgi:MFS family permease